MYYEDLKLVVMENSKCNVFRKRNTPDHCMKRVCTERFKCRKFYCEFQEVIVSYDLNAIKSSPSLSKFQEFDPASQMAINYL